MMAQQMAVGDGVAQLTALQEGGALLTPRSLQARFAHVRVRAAFPAPRPACQSIAFCWAELSDSRGARCSACLSTHLSIRQSRRLPTVCPSCSSIPDPPVHLPSHPYIKPSGARHAAGWIHKPI
eukprot:359470-Chlamydomonas_euryale.AAC.1